MLKEIAVLGATLKIIPSTIGGSAVILSAPSSVENIDGKGIYSGVISVQVSGTIQGTCVQGSPATGTITPTSINQLSGGKPLRKGDLSGIINISGNTVPGGSPCSYTCTVEVDSSGQSPVVANSD